VLHAGLEALQGLLQPENVIYLFVGVALGIMTGLLPGFGGIAGMSVLLPFIYGMEPEQGLAMLLGLIAVNNTSDVFPSALLGVPGSSSAQATILDGYPLSRQGKGMMVLSSSLTSALVGGLIGSIVVYAAIFAARPVVLAFGSPELFMLILLGLSMVGILSRGSAIAGLLSAFIGLILGAVGAAPTAPEYRYTFDQLYLFDGIPLPVLALGLFAMPEIIGLLVEGKSIAKGGKLEGSRKEGIATVWRYKWLSLRSALMGTFIGFLPGLGSSVAQWIAYGVASLTRKNNKFGKGDIRGVIAPDSACNAADAGGLVPTMLFGIPGSGSFAVLLGGMTLLGLQPGPGLLTDDLPLVLSTTWTFALANIVAAIVCLAASKYVAKITQIPAHVLAPFLVVIMVVAAYQSTQNWGDIIALLVLGTMGWIMKELGWPRAPLLVGFVLSVPAERYLWTSTATYGLDWLTDPLVVGIGVVIVVILSSGAIVQRNLSRTETRATAKSQTTITSGE
jgi:putative tricarboxylic transport membrane protein